MLCTPGRQEPPCDVLPHKSDSVCSVQEELQSMQARAQYAESRAAVAEAELQSLRKVCLHSTLQVGLAIMLMASNIAQSASASLSNMKYKPCSIA